MFSESIFAVLVTGALVLTTLGVVLLVVLFVKDCLSGKLW